MTFFRTTTITLLLFVSVVTYGLANGSTIDITQKTVTKEKKGSFRKQMRCAGKRTNYSIKRGSFVSTTTNEKKFH